MLRLVGKVEAERHLIEARVRERWLRDEYLYHVWHPNETGINSDYQGFGPGGLVEDLKLGLGTLFTRHAAFKRVAVVSDKDLKVEAGTCVVQVGKRKFAKVTLA